MRCSRVAKKYRKLNEEKDEIIKQLLNILQQSKLQSIKNLKTINKRQVFKLVMQIQKMEEEQGLLNKSLIGQLYEM